MRADASLQNQTLCTDLWLVAKQICKSAPKFMQVSKVVNFMHIHLTCDQLVSTCIGWPNGEKLVLTCGRIWAQPKSTLVIASPHKWVGKWNASWMQVKNLHWLASPFGQDFKLKTKTKKPQWTYMQAACHVTDIPSGVLLVLEPKPHLCQGLERNDVNRHVMLWDSDNLIKMLLEAMLCTWHVMLWDSDYN